MNSPVEELVEYINSTLDYLTSVDFYAEVPTVDQIESTLRGLYDRLTLGGSLPTPDWSLLHSPPIQPVVVHRSVALRAWDGIKDRPYLTLFVISSSLLGTTIYLYPRAVKRQMMALFRPLRNYVPIRLLPKSDRPLRSGASGENRKEAVLVLGADTGAGRAIALDFETRGFVVICTVRDPSEVEVLERRSRGHLKVLVLDDSNSSSVPPFLRSLSSALSLRFPLHSAGDPFSRPAHTLALTTVVNCLSLDQRNELRPMEGMESDEVGRGLGERVATMIAVLRGVMPTLRTMASRPSAPQGTIVTLLPCTSKIALPFASLPAAADAAISSLLDAFRRELARTPNNNIRLVSLEVGFFQTFTAIAPSPSAAAYPTPLLLSSRLSALYAPALMRRRYLGNGNEIAGETIKARKGSPLRVLNDKVFHIIAYNRGGHRTRVGAGSSTYRFVSFLPTSFVDAFLSIQDSLVALLLANRARIISTTPPPSVLADTPQATSSSSASHPPLPTPPSYSDSVRPSAPNSVASGEESEVEDLLSTNETFSFIGSEAEWRSEPRA